MVNSMQRLRRIPDRIMHHIWTNIPAAAGAPTMCRLEHDMSLVLCVQQIDAIKSELVAMNAAKRDAEARVSEKRKEVQKAEAQANKLKHMCVPHFPSKL